LQAVNLPLVPVQLGSYDVQGTSHILHIMIGLFVVVVIIGALWAGSLVVKIWKLRGQWTASRIQLFRLAFRSLTFAGVRSSPGEKLHKLRTKSDCRVPQMFQLSAFSDRIMEADTWPASERVNAL